MYLTILYVTFIVLFFIVRYDLDYRLFAVLRGVHESAETDEELPSIEEIYPVRDSSFYDEYDERMERMRKEVEQYNNAPSDASEQMGVFNIPHEQVKLELDLEPPVEEEQELGRQEIAR